MSDKNSVRTRTSESVTVGHPDKVADQISDAVLDACLEQDPGARVACETLVTGGRVILAGEITTSAEVDRAAVVRRTVAEIGYTTPALGFDATTLELTELITAPSSEVLAGASRSLEARGGSEDSPSEGAGDQGVVFGYATVESREMIPFAHVAARRLTDRLTQLRRDGTLEWLRPDGKAQVAVGYDTHDRPVSIERVVLSAQHAPEISLGELRSVLLEQVVLAVDWRPWPHDAPLKIQPERVQINPAGPLTFGGPAAETGVTGHKIVLDAYGAGIPVGGGAFSGKDPSKMDRSAAYAARHVAINLVHGGFVDRVLVKIAYAIGVAEPVVVEFDTLGDGRNVTADLADLVRQEFDLRPAAIRQALDLNRPIYLQTAAQGPFGHGDPKFRDGGVDVPWEHLDRSTSLERRAQKLADRSDQELIAALNQTLASAGWVAAKGRYLVALRDELASRGLTPPIREHGGIYVFGHGTEYEIREGAVLETDDPGHLK